MMTILLLSTLGMLLTMKFVPRNFIWSTSMSQTSLLLLFSFFLFKEKTNSNWKHLSKTLACDPISSPLMILSFWLIPMSMMANISPLYKTSTNKQQNFTSLLLIILFFLIVTFSTTSLIIFFMGFESTLVPTLLLITRWGAQNERMEAGYYFVFYTLLSSLPLLLALLFIYLEINSLSLLLKAPQKLSSPCSMACILAFLVKVPIFGFHLWLPKAHVEAPMAGSMILAAILLKMGGYGFMRLYKFLSSSLYPTFSSTLVLFCCWGGLLTSLMCLTQTDLKSLIAYSSVSHMSFMIAALATGTSWGLSAGMLIMMAHGLTSSALFSLAKLLYERSGTRTLYLNRGFKQFHSLLPLFWLFFLASNLGLPPFPKSMGELLCFSAILSHSTIPFLLIGGALIMTSIFSLKIYLLTCSGWSTHWHTASSPLQEREILLLILHALPLLLLISAPSFMT